MALTMDKPPIMGQQLGKPLSGKILRPYGYETLGACELGAPEITVAITFYPRVGDADFAEPVVVLLAEGDVEKFISAIRIAHARISPELRKGGSS
jgi:hypothetical protein